MNTRHLFIAVALVAAAVLPSSAAASVPSSLTETAAFVPSALYMAEAPAAKAADAVSSAAVPAAAASSVRAAAAPAASTPVGRNGWLSVSGPRLVNEAGNPVVLTGASIGWHNLWPRFYNAGVVSTLADDWGCDVVRAAIGAELEGNYASDPETALQCLYNVVDAAVSEGISVSGSAIVSVITVPGNNPSVGNCRISTNIRRRRSRFSSSSNGEALGRLMLWMGPTISNVNRNPARSSAALNTSWEIERLPLRILEIVPLSNPNC